ncbi:hypothetical protein [Paenibacillus naphthalenovorans]|uniref:hypothetical protein n=1 Tax=Paenibacillus naphthalenovorans TaxID=162209 RepID=UPI003D2A49E4
MSPNEGMTQIIIKDGKTELYINGVRIDGLRYINFSAHVDKLPELKIDVFPPGSIKKNL